MDQHSVDPAAEREAKHAGMFTRTVRALDNSPAARWMFRLVMVLIGIIGALGWYIVDAKVTGDTARDARLEKGINDIKQDLTVMQRTSLISDQRLERAFERLTQQDRRIERIENKVFP